MMKCAAVLVGMCLWLLNAFLLWLTWKKVVYEDYAVRTSIASKWKLGLLPLAKQAGFFSIMIGSIEFFRPNHLYLFVGLGLGLVITPFLFRLLRKFAKYEF